MNKQIICMFSGQGSQYYKMGKELYEHNEQFRYWMNHCNEIVFPLIRTSLIDVLYGGKRKSEPFDNILYTNPAILTIQYSMFKLLKEMGIQPDFLLGYSMGELHAAVVSGAISLEDGIRVSVDIAKLTHERTQPAGMLAIMEPKSIMTRYPDLFHNCWLTAGNFQENFVVSGLPHAIQNLHQNLNKENIISQILPVKYGFHTKLIDPIEEAYTHIFSNIKVVPPKIPVISSLQAGTVRELNGDYVWKAIRYPVNFEQTIERILETGDYTFIDMGPSGTLSTFVKYILPSDSDSISLQMINQFGSDLNVIQKLRTCLC
ncbi:MULTISPECIES: acyltransferase domain-containing protein [Aquimarina]|uniref:acyltransferase domain-containing protein n=1 Tax=Aquimarina TaxID=290174 RepID=UPI000943B92B|nr:MULTISPECIES: acyltransferase domain-containing protein [Aquimarina]